MRYVRSKILSPIFLIAISASSCLPQSFPNAPTSAVPSESSEIALPQEAQIPKNDEKQPEEHAEKAAEKYIEGHVLDPSGSPIAGAVITVRDITNREVCKTSSAADGSFNCPGIPSGEFKLLVNAIGFVDHTELHLSVTEAHPSANLPITLTIQGSNASVTVSASSQEIATAQVNAAEKQRILAIVPNFYSSYATDPAPLTSKQKFSLAFRDVIDPVTFLSAGVTAGIGQAENSHKAYGQGAEGFGKRYGAAYTTNFTSDIFRHAVYASLFHEDPRYFYQGTGSFRSRFIHAISYAVILRGDDGSNKPNYAYLAGYLTSGALANIYYPQADRGVGLVFSRAGIGIAGTAGEGLLREFIFSHLTTHRRLTP